MAKTKKSKPGEKRRQGEKEQMANGNSEQSPEQLYASALSLVEQGEPESALQQAQKLWTLVQSKGVAEQLPAINLLGELSIENGDADTARTYFERAVALDPEGRIPEAQGGGAEKFLWLAQLNEEGGAQSVRWFEAGVKALQHEINVLESGQAPNMDEEALLVLRTEKKRKMANALCGIVEVYMTDLSWENDAEARCESLITQAMAVEDDTSPEILHTLASVRLSQQRQEDAQAALKRSLEIWSDLDPEDPEVPDFPNRISLARLLMEAELTSEAMQVINRLVLEDDQSVEAWYLGGWCQHLITEAEKAKSEAAGSPPDADAEAELERAMKGSRHWLKTAVKLCGMLDYEDDRLLQHAEELVAALDAALGPEDEKAEEQEWEDNEWGGLDDENEGEDDEMQDA